MARAIFAAGGVVHVKIIGMLILLYLDTIDLPKAQIRSIDAFQLEVLVTAFALQHINHRTHHGS